MADRAERALEQRRKKLMEQCLTQVEQTAANIAEVEQMGGYVAGGERRAGEFSATLDNAATAVLSKS